MKDKTGWFKEQRWTVSLFLRLEVQNQGVSGLIPSEICGGRVYSWPPPCL